jgi:hypothetical protein
VRFRNLPRPARFQVRTARAAVHAAACPALQVHAPEFVASQMDWAALQESNRCEPGISFNVGLNTCWGVLLVSPAAPLCCIPGSTALLKTPPPPPPPTPPTTCLPFLQGPVAGVRAAGLCWAGRRQRRAPERGVADWGPAGQAAGGGGGLCSGGRPVGGWIRRWVLPMCGWMAGTDGGGGGGGGTRLQCPPSPPLPHRLLSSFLPPSLPHYPTHRCRGG